MMLELHVYILILMSFTIFVFEKKKRKTLTQNVHKILKTLIGFLISKCLHSSVHASSFLLFLNSGKVEYSIKKVK